MSLVVTTVASVALYLLVVAPVLAVSLLAIRRERPDTFERAVTDIQDFIDLRERARAELAATDSLDRFIATKQEARKHLWRSS